MRPIDKLREICLALPHAHEVEAWGEPTFRVKNKIFVMYANADNHHGGGRPALWCKAAPGEQQFLIKADPQRFFAPPYVGPSGWVGMWLDKRPRWKQVEELVRDAYRLTAPRKLQAIVVSALLLLWSVSPVNAQQLSGGLNVSWLGIGGGTYSTNAVGATGLGARLSFTPAFARGHASISALYSAFPRDPGETPSISAAGIEVALIANPRGLLRPFVGIGTGFIRFAPRAGEFPPCDAEQGCMAEGAPQFRQETALTLRPAAGLTAAVTSQFSLFGDLKLHLREDTPWNGSNYQPEFSLGFTYRSLF